MQYTPLPTPPPTDTNTQAAVTSDQSKGRWKGFVSTLVIIILAPVIAFLLTQLVFQSYEVDGPSMETSLQNHDRLIIWKTARTWSKVTGHPYIPNRGDVIVFELNGNNVAELRTNQKKQLIKRVIGLPGERVVVSNGKLTVYNKEYPEGFEPDKSLPYGSAIPATTRGKVDVVVGEHEVFVNGDNRSNSLDSRDFGPVSADKIIGKLAIRILPLSKAKLF